ncbi:hypothetical protein NIES4101_33410 [Calothrix sp. NIES-4101]|nr:hypothetical protein NIES4101_33410 [Calothrix sp. NIES-4101]
MYTIISLTTALQFLTATFVCSTICLILVCKICLEVAEMIEASEQ